MLKIGIIGCGNMGSALVENIKKKLSPQDIFVTDKDKAKEAGFVKNFGVKFCSDVKMLVSLSNVVIIAVKPQDIDTAMVDLGDVAGKLFISIAAGKTINNLESVVGKKTAIVRAMPNINALISEGVTALCKNDAARDNDLKIAAEIFKSVGEVVFVKEELINAVTAISGSGPAFVAYLKDFDNKILESVFVKEAQNLGIEQKIASVLAIATVSGTRKMLFSNLDADMLIKRVCSKGGTTEAGMKVLEEKGKTEEALAGAIQAAYKRAGELAKNSR